MLRGSNADGTLGAWHFLPKEYYDKHQLREQIDVDEQVFTEALANPLYDTVVYFHGNALDRAAPWRVNFYKVKSKRAGLKCDIYAIYSKS